MKVIKKNLKKVIAKILFIMFSAGAILAETKYSFVYGADGDSKEFTLSAKNMHRCFKAENSTDYFAGFLVDGGNNEWKIWKKDDSNNYSWQIATTTEIAQLKSIYNETSNKKIELESSDEINRIEDFAYYEVDKTVNNIKQDDGIDNLTIYDKEKGFFIFGKKDDNKYDTMVFKCKDTLLELKDNNFDKWLENSKKFPIAKNDKNKEAIAALIYDSLNSNTPFFDIYTEPNSIDNISYYNDYLKKAFEAGINVLKSTKYFYGSKNKYIPSNYEVVNEVTGINIAKAAKRFLTHAIEYRISNVDESITFNRIKEKGFDILKNEVIDGNPMPYCKNGVDSPETFWQKMSRQVDVLIEKNNYSKNDYLPGTQGMYSTPKGAGCDNIGMLTSVLYTAGLSDKIKWVSSIAENKPIKNYESYIADPLKKIPANGNIAYLLQFTNGLRIEKTSLDYITVIVPDKSSIRNGDLIQNNAGEIGIITDYNTDDFNKIKFVWMNEELGYAEETCLADNHFTADKHNVIVRRILINKADNKTYTVPGWDVLDSEPELSASSISIVKMKEETQNSGENFRLIPNTGEYLILSGIHMKIYNKAGVLLKGNDYKINLAGAVDRNYAGESDTNGNIYNNTNCKFEIVIKSGNKNQKGLLTKDKESYKLTDVDEENSILNAEFTVEDGGLLYCDSNKLKIGIRPENASSAHPGDDLILQFSNNLSTTPINVDEDSWVAVYDKKMVWRANLYMNKKDTGEDSKNYVDWNMAHPWNVPADESDFNNRESNNEIPEWWNATDWGYNEWNRTFVANRNNSYKMKFGVGNGEQVIELSDFSWNPVRLGWVDINKPIQSVTYSSTVAYDIPDDDFKIFMAWDSPFDFAWKMNEQRKAIFKHYTNYINNSSRPATSQYEEAFIPDGTGNKNVSINGILNIQLKNWSSTKAPLNQWGLYWKETENNQFAYNPGLGLYFHDLENGRGNLDPRLFTDSKKEDPIFEFTAKKSSGTDCLGFVERTASYTENIYAWADTEKDLAETANSSEWTIDKTRKPGINCTYPENKENICDEIIKRKDISNKMVYFTTEVQSEESEEEGETSDGPNEDDFRKLQVKFKSIMPGDIINYSGSHIGEIAYVNYDAIDKASTISQLLQSVVVIESVYNGKASYVLKRNMLAGGYEADSINVTNGTSGSWLFSTAGTLTDTNLRDWVIRRLR